MNITKLIPLICMVVISGCATPYQNNAFAGGYSETQLDKNVYKVSFKGNGYTSKERASDFALLRSAEIALDNGYKYFAIVNKDSYTKEGAYTTPKTSTTTANAYSYGNTVQGTATTTTSGGQTYHISKPRRTNTIVLFKDEPDGFSYNAEFIYRKIREKYNINNQKESKGDEN